MSTNLGSVLTTGIVYRVLASTRCNTFEEEDRIRREADGSLYRFGPFRHPPGTWERYRCRVEVDKQHYEAIIRRARAEIAMAGAVLGYEVSA